MQSFFEFLVSVINLYYINRLHLFLNSFGWFCLQISSDAKYFFLSCSRHCDLRLIVVIVYNFQIWSKKEHIIIICRVISRHMDPMYIELPYISSFMGPIYIETPYISSFMGPIYIETPYISSFMGPIYIETPYINQCWFSVWLRSTYDLSPILNTLCIDIENYINNV